MAKKVVAPTDAEIVTEIAALKELRPHIRKTTAFGDDNDDALGSQIYILERRLCEDEVYDRYEPRGEEDEQNSEHTLTHALDAVRWMRGEGDGERPSDGWRELDQRTKSARVRGGGER